MASVKVYVLCQDTGDYGEVLEALHGFTKREDAELTRDMLIGLPEIQSIYGETMRGNWHVHDFVIVEVSLT